MARMRSKMRAVESSMASAMRSARTEDANCDSTMERESALRNFAQRIELLCRYAQLGKFRRNLPCLLDAVISQPGLQACLRCAACCDRIGRVLPRACSRMLSCQSPHLEQVLFVETKTAEFELLLAVDAQLIEQARGSSLRSRCGIVHLVGKISGQLAEGVELFGLLLEAGDFADAIEQNGDAALPHRGHRAKHLGKHLAVEIERPDIGDDVSVSAVGLHAREGKQAGDLAGAANEEGLWARRVSRRTWISPLRRMFILVAGSPSWKSVVPAGSKRSMPCVASHSYSLCSMP